MDKNYVVKTAVKLAVGAAVSAAIGVLIKEERNLAAVLDKRLPSKSPFTKD